MELTWRPERWANNQGQVPTFEPPARRRVFSMHIVLQAAACAVALLASALASPLRAQQPTSSSPYAGPLLDRSTLTGNWGGARDDLAAAGITVAPSLTQFYQGPIAGNADHVFDYGGKAEAFVNFDLAKLGLWNGFAMQVHGEYNFGRTPGAVGGTTFPNNTAMTFPYQNQAGADFTSVYFTQRFGSNFTVLAGKTNLIDLYGAGQKFNGGRGIERFFNIAFAAPPSGTLPVSMFGTIATLKADPLTYSLWVYDPRETLNRTGLEDPFSQGVSVRGSVDLSSTLFGLSRRDGIAGYTSSYKGTDFTTLPDLGRFADTPALRDALIKAFVTGALWGRDPQTVLPPELQQSPPSEKRGRWYFSYSFEQTLWQNPTNPNRSWGLFGQVAVSDGNPNSTKWSALGGVGGTGPFSGRPNDKFGVGVFYYAYAKELKKHLDPLITLGDEYGVEAFYNLAVTKWFLLTADLQVVAPAIKAQLIAPRTLVNNSTAAIVGLRGQIVF
jgi:porin